ncbi:WD40 repeat protein [Phaffia rhodozyma]|uniref:Probable cytosolic iron-sulfur protein assembly protein 1 n=1 Tax=Phaffia rhodozyma TaxID=264483 RepID=A0A0F7SS68_PHARH|nr:WD40 repeat protein [Phaffia rhodozyma]
MPFQLVATLSGHTDRAWSIAWSPSEPILASCSTDKTVRLYTYSGEPNQLQVRPLSSISTGHSRTLRNIAFSPSGQYLATASFDATVGIWERQPASPSSSASDSDPASDQGEWECVSTLEGHDSECKSVTWSSTGGLLASCSRDKSVWVWEVQPEAEFECLSVLMEHTQDVKAVLFHPHEEILASASYDDTILLYTDDPQSDWSPFQTLRGHQGTVWTMAWSPCGRWLASAGEGGEIRIWKRTGQTAEALFKPAFILPDVHSRTIYSLSWTDTNSLSQPSSASPSIATASDSTTATIQEKTDERILLGRLASAGGDGKICSVDSKTQDSFDLTLQACQEDAHGVSDVNTISWCPRNLSGSGDEKNTGGSVLASAGDDWNVKVWVV